MRRRFGGHTQLLQTDGGSEFKDQFLVHVLEYCSRHRVARPYKRNEQSYIESFNRTVRKECLGWGKYKQTDVERLTPRVEVFLQRYRYHQPHLGIEPYAPAVANF